MNVQLLNFNSKEDFEILFKENYKKLCRTALRIVSDEAVAEDVVQEVFIRVWENRAKNKININIQAYLQRAVINSSYNYLSKKKVIHFDPLSDKELNSVKMVTGNVASMDLKKLEELISFHIDKLPPKCKTIFVLSRYEHLKYREIAETLDISIKTVEGQMSIAISRLTGELKPILQKHFPDLVILSVILSFLYFI